MFLRWSFVFILAASFAWPAAAQSIFNKYEGGKADQPADGGDAEKPAAGKPSSSIFVKPQGLGAEAASIKIDPKEYKVPDAIKLKNKAQQEEAEAKIAIYQEWTNSGRTPQTAEEILMFADASRAFSQATMLMRREALIEHLEKVALEDKKRAALDALQLKKEEAEAAKALKEKAAKDKSAKEAAVSKGQKTDKKVEAKPADVSQKAAPSGAKPVKLYNSASP